MSLNSILATTPLTSTNFILKATGTTIGNSLIWDNGTNVGIGNQGTTYTLDVSGTGRYTTSLLVNDISISSSTMQASGNYYIGCNNANFIQFYTSNTDRMAITAAGLVGIGTTNPQVLLHIVKSSNPRLDISTTDSYSTAKTIYITQTGTTGIVESYSYLSGVGLPLALNPSGGSVLVGTTISDGAAFQVLGNIESRGSASGFQFQNRPGTNYFIWYGYTNVLLYNTDVGNIAQIAYNTGVFTPLSDINKKKDFEDSTIGLNAILGLKPTLYRMKSDDELASKELGFIAQEVKEFIPQAYVENGENDEKFIGLNYNSIVAVLVKAVQELSKQNEELSNRLIKLESK
jgi:hypothetical protein